MENSVEPSPLIYGTIVVGDSGTRRNHTIQQNLESKEPILFPDSSCLKTSETSKMFELIHWGDHYNHFRWFFSWLFFSSILVPSCSIRSVRQKLNQKKRLTFGPFWLGINSVGRMKIFWDSCATCKKWYAPRLCPSATALPLRSF